MNEISQAERQPDVEQVEQTIYFNEKSITVVAGLTLRQLLGLHSIDPQSVAVVVNQAVIPRGHWSEQLCQPQDKIDVFTVVAGG
ncbi:sulfur carrier protein ThiS [Shewanella surugensis]|uniref:Sulfur carrier protein ThiS n=1 Tax=Shewanella surugensis TaxID=212020 RepID=A0ABT0LF60_9GAMM|nr:sulfur carrier protein ThiS [Shewanella surugensis]MCL1126333.1 sulfur carrier protein ThiS [Shewanella surugensis]